MKGTYRTAFEWAKFILSLDPTGDPYCMSLMIHQLALRANEFDWLLEMCDHRRISAEEKQVVMITRLDAYRYHFAPSLAFAALQLRDGKRSRRLLTEGMQQLPWLFARLFQELNLDVPPSIWGITPRTRAEELFTTLYVKYTKDLWDTPGATALLMEIAHTISKVDASTIPKIKDDALNLNVVRFIYLDNTPELMAMVPSSLLHRSNNSDSDPIPPDNSIISYPSQRIPLQQRGDAGFENMLQNFNDPLAAIQRLIPDLNNLVGRGEDIGRGGLFRWGRAGGDGEGEPLDDEDSEMEEEYPEDNMEETEEQVAATGNWMGNFLWGRRPAADQGNQRTEREDDAGESGETRDDAHGNAH